MNLDEAQSEVDAAIRSLGGYWPALAGLARVTEEIGELVAAIDGEAGRELLHEAADCVVASMALANQYAMSLSGCLAPPIVYGEPLHAVLVHAGRVARAVNRLEGSKPPKPEEPSGWLDAEFIGLFEALAQLAGLPLSELLFVAVEIVRRNAVRDATRFVARIDPVTSPCRDAFVALACDGPASPTLGLWGVVDCTDGGTIDLHGALDRFDRVDSVAPLGGLVLAPVAIAVVSEEGLAAVGLNIGRDLAQIGAGARPLVLLGDPIAGLAYILVRGRRPMPPLRIDLPTLCLNSEAG